MRELTVYDSQGAPLDAEGRGKVNERIKDFFFGGVRIALETVGNTYKLTAFFRARDDSASRSEQYYGVLETDDGSELSNFKEIIENHLQTEYGKDLVTTKEDTTVFEELSGGGLRSPPGSQTTRSEIADLVNDGERALVGVGSYEDATTLLTSYLGEIDNPRIAIAENAQSSTLSDYGLVIEKGSYTGLELLGETEQRIEDMKERKRKEREQMLGGPGLDDPYGQQQQGMFDSTRTLALAAIGGVVALLVIISVAACFIGVSVPVVGGMIPLDCGAGGDGGGGGGGNGAPAVSITNATVKTDSSQTAFLYVEGTLSYGQSSPSDGNVTLGYTVNDTTTDTQIAAGTHNVTNQTFTLNLDANEGESFNESRNYNVTITWEAENKSHTVTTPWNASEATATPTPTPTSDDESTPTTESTPAPTPTPTPDDQTSAGSPSFNVTDVSLNSPNVTVGDDVNGTISVQNDGDASGQVTLEVNASFDNTSVLADIEPDQSKESTFSLLTDDASPGDYDIRVSVDGSVQARTTVTIEAQSS